MKEDFLHYVWKFQKFTSNSFKSTTGENIQIDSVGQHNHGEGPDFFNAKIRINQQLWAGNVEIHIKSSDWYMHHHQGDSNYDSVILHVVWEHDVEVFRADRTPLITLEIKHLVLASALENYTTLTSAMHRWIPCESFLSKVDVVVRTYWLERLYFERLEGKSVFIFNTLSHYHNNWDAVLFVMLCKNFGLQKNGASFYSIATSVNYAIWNKCMNDPFDLECLLLGRAGLLKHEALDTYQQQLFKRYEYLTLKFQLKPQEVIAPVFFRLRPSNFPTIRLSQFAQLMSSQNRLFSKLVSATSIAELLPLFNVFASSYWETHFNFGVASKKFAKRLSRSFIELLCINTVLPILYCYGMYQGNDVSDTLLQMATDLSAEKNTIIKKFDAIGQPATQALESQGLLQLYKNYCLPSKCVQCAIGNEVLKRS